MTASRLVKELLVKRIVNGSLTKSDIAEAKMKLVLSEGQYFKVRKTQKLFREFAKVWG